MLKKFLLTLVCFNLFFSNLLCYADVNPHNLSPAEMQVLEKVGVSSDQLTNLNSNLSDAKEKLQQEITDKIRTLLRPVNWNFSTRK